MEYQKTRLTQFADTRANQPVATAVAQGTYYAVTDENVLEFSDGATWSTALTGGSAPATFTPTIVPFADGAGALTEDATNFTYDDTNDTLQTPRWQFLGGSVPPTPGAGEGIIFGASSGGHTAPSYMDESGIIVRMTRDLTLLVRNNSGSSMAKGNAIRFTGSTGVTPTIGLADADVFDSGRPRAAVGLCLETIANNAFGVILLSGLISGIDTSAFIEGTTVFLSTTAGALTNTAPNTAGCFVQPCGQVTRSHATQGSLELDFEVPATTLLANLTVGRVPYVGTGPILVDDADFTFDESNNTLMVPTIVGGTGTGSDLSLKSTTGVGDDHSRVFIKTGNNGAVVSVEVTPGAPFGMMGIGTAGNVVVDSPLVAYGVGADLGYLIKARAQSGNAYCQMMSAGGDANGSAGFSFYQQQNGVEWRMAVIGNGGDYMRWQGITGSGSVTNTVLFLGPTSKNLLLADAYTSDVTTGVRCLVLEIGTTPTAVAANTVAIYAKDVAGSAELFVMNEAGNETQLSF